MKWIRFLLILMLFPYASHGISWIRSQGGVNTDGAGAIDGLPGGDIVTASWFSVMVYENLQNYVSHGGTDILLMRTDNSGVFSWIKQIGGTGDDRVVTITHDQSGNILVAGFFSNTLTVDGHTITSAGNQDAFVLKLDAAGNTIWLQGFGGIYNDIVNAVTVDAGGIIYCTGNYTGNVVIGSTILNSLIDVNGTQPSQDIFTASWSSSGSFRWAKSGGSHYSDLGEAITTDQVGNVYITGQFSDTIQFDTQHPNIISNAIYIVKYSASGNELWFNYAGGGSLSRVRDICYDGSNYIYIAGECIGNTQFFGSPAISSSNTYVNRTFITRYDLNGNPLLVKSDGSTSAVSVSGIAKGSNGKLYLTGLFRCKFNEYCNQYGQGTFNSVGYTDVFISCYDPSLNRIWSRQAGGPDLDEVNGITVAGTDTLPALAGTFRRKFNVPVSTPAAFKTYGNAPSLNPAYAVGFQSCGDPDYGEFTSCEVFGSTDIYFGKIVDPTRLPYDFYTRRNTSCIADMVGVCISVSGADDECTDPIGPYCGGITLYAATNTSHSRQSSSVGPEFNFLWSTGSTGNTTTANASGNYTVTITSMDGCFSSTDSLTTPIVVNQRPSTPTISDSKGVNVNAQFPNIIYLCAPDSVTLSATNMFPGITGTWTFKGVSSPGPDLTIYFTGAYTGQALITYSSGAGCTSSNTVPFIVDSSGLATIKPYINVKDTTIVCDTIANIPIDLRDSLTMQPCNIKDISYINWQFSPNTLNQGAPCYSVNFNPSATGTYTVTAECVRSKCGISDTIQLSRSFFVQLNNPPVVNGFVTGNAVTQICPGDSVTFTASGGDFYDWGNGSTSQSITVNLPGSYCVKISKDSAGCVGEMTICRSVVFPPSPVISGGSVPVVLCPNDSVLLTVTTPGIAYNWSGPGVTFSTNSTLYAKQPGFYYCNVTDSTGCVLISNQVEVLQYSSPFLTALPGTLFCPGDSVQLTANTIGSAVIQWQAPLSGSSQNMYATTGGTYVCSMTQCGITTIDSVQLIQSQLTAQILQNDTSLCYGDSIKLTLAPFSGTAVWYPDTTVANEYFATNENSYYVTIVDANGCTAISNIVNINVDTVHAADSIVTNAPLCEGEMLLLLPEIPSNTQSAIWTGPNGFNSTLTHLFLDSVRPSQSGYYVMQAVIGLCISEPDSVLVTIYDSVPNYALTHSLLCEGEIAIVSAAPLPVFDVQWISPSNVIGTDTSFTVSNYSAADSGYYVLHVENGTCPSFTESIYLGLPVAGYVNITASDTLVCQGEVVTVNALSSAGTLSWYPSGAGTSATFTSAGTVYCMLDDANGCTFHSDSLQLHFNSPSSIVTMDDMVSCADDMVMLNADVSPGTIAPVYFWSGPAGFSSSQVNPVISNVSSSNAGTYNLMLTDSVCPPAAGSLNLIVNNSAAAPVISSEIPQCAGDTLQLTTPEITGVNVMYIDPSGDSTINHILSIPTTHLADTGWYYCYAMTDGCPPAVDSILVSFDSCRVEDGQWFLPNVFSPNNDGVNEIFLPGIPDGEDGTLTIVNRWGKTIFEGKASKGWNGKSDNGEAHPEGTYFWMIRPDVPNSRLEKPNGYLQLVR